MEDAIQPMIRESVSDTCPLGNDERVCLGTRRWTQTVLWGMTRVSYSE
jgi:hypothetical protein